MTSVLKDPLIQKIILKEKSLNTEKNSHICACEVDAYIQMNTSLSEPSKAIVLRMVPFPHSIRVAIKYLFNQTIITNEE